ncbi:Kinesin-like protein unc-104 [Elsinoe australis]|uniref:Kinesin-like protein unc-104 n=1 Tax=Elsinoe australis TaxID=40998 RepID=A0A2P7Z695_9PEZI|nr:Kinesin-like protein unc-104 [Elsinoe australis]
MSTSPVPGSPDSAKASGKAASPERPPSQHIDFEFLNFSHPSEAKASRARRTVRSHVTRQQHQREQQAAAAARRTRSFPQGSDPDAARRPPRLRTHHTISVPDEVPKVDISPLRSSRSEPSSSVASTAPSPLQSPSGSLSGSAQLDPYDLYPPEWHSSISIVIDHYLVNLATENSDLDGNQSRGLLRLVWFPFVLTDTALLHSVLLLAAAHCRLIKGPESHGIDIITLRGMALRGINENLQHPAKSLSDETIGAVLSVAMYEALFGDSDTYATHMTGLQKLVTLRGGLPELGLDGLLEKMLLWVDSNASYITGYNLFFPRTAYPSSRSHPLPNPQQFGSRRPLQTHSP